LHSGTRHTHRIAIGHLIRFARLIAKDFARTQGFVGRLDVEAD
jgi:hypothetical protein